MQHIGICHRFRTWARHGVDWRVSGALLPLLTGLWCWLAGAVALASTPEEDWLLDDWEARARAVSGGELRLVAPTEQSVHFHQNRIVVSARTLETGWARMEQCHDGLDPVPAAQVVYHPERIRNIEIALQQGIGKAWVDGPSVQLENIAPGARLCVSADTLAFEDLGQGRWVLRNGPFMRRFLDGFYPMHLALTVESPPGLIELDASEPAAQPGFSVETRPGEVRVDTWFEGELRTALFFRRPG